MRKTLIVFIFLGSLLSCKSTKVDTEDVSYLPSRVIIKKNKEASFDRSSIKASMTVKYRGKEEMPNINASLRMIKDSIIWINFSKLGFPVAKLMITPEEVKFYEKIGKTAFEGNFNLISDWLGTEFDFEKVQNLFLGETLLHLDKGRYLVSIQENKHELRPKKRNAIFDIYYWIDPDNFKLVKEELSHTEKNQNLTILYKDFDKINESLFPKGFLVTAKGDQQTTIIEVNYRNVQFDVPLKFPFKTPTGYRNIELE